MPKKIEARPYQRIPAGKYELQRPVFNHYGDGRSKGAHWRSKMERKLELPAGYRWEADEEGNLFEGGRQRISGWMYSEILCLGVDPSAAERKNFNRLAEFVRDLFVSSVPVQANIREAMNDRGWRGCDMSETFVEAAEKLGIARETLFDAAQAIVDAEDLDRETSIGPGPAQV